MVTGSAEVNSIFSLTPQAHFVTVMELDSNYNMLHFSTVPYFVQ